MKNTIANLEFAFDVGHNSIGWSVLDVSGDGPEIKGCGTVIFEKDGCLASKRRTYRRQRRNIRATRQRIARMKKLLLSLSVLSETELDAVASSSPWFLAAGVLTNGRKLSWPELWDVLRWYAHNRGYDGNQGWAANEVSSENDEDKEKVENARGLYAKHGTQTMAETLCAELGLDPKSDKSASGVRFKGLKAAFRREDVTAEIRRILESHKGVLSCVDEVLIRTLIGNGRSDVEAWKTIPVEGMGIPLRYRGSLLLGQLIPRFENRIISRCPILYQRILQEKLNEGMTHQEAEAEASKLSKVPTKSSIEFLKYRWAMMLANVVVGEINGRMRPLTIEERKKVNEEMCTLGAFTKGGFILAVLSATNATKSNLEEMLTDPDAVQSLVLDAAIQKTQQGTLAIIWPHLDEPMQKRIRGKLRHGKKIFIRDAVDGNEAAMEALNQSLQPVSGKKASARKEMKTLDSLLSESVELKPISGRAPYSREIMIEAIADVMDRGIDPTAKGGVLYRSEAIRLAQVQRDLDDQTNNHLVRHRLLILERLHHDLLKEYAEGEIERIGRITIEVNSELREMSGKTAKEAAQEEGLKLADFKSVIKDLEKKLEEAKSSGKGFTINAGLIRKARIAQDQGWKCPYTGKDFDVFDLIHGKVDKDHIIPRSLRPSDSLDSLVITFSEVNRMKGPRTAAAFIEEFGGKQVEGRPELSMMPFARYKEIVESLDERKGHDGDKRRKKNRKRLLLLKDYVEKEFTPGDLTRTSQLVRLGAQLLSRPYLAIKYQPTITSLPGSVTGAVRKSWRLLGCLKLANPEVTDETTKTEIRSITHLHHALDASILALATYFLPRDGGIWKLIVKRNLTNAEQKYLLAKGRQFARDSEGRVSLIDLPTYLKHQLSTCLAERRVVQHISADMSGLAAEETVYRVLDPSDNHPSAQKIRKWCATSGIEIPDPKEEMVLLVARKRREEKESAKPPKNILHETKTWRWTWQYEKRSKLMGLESREAQSGKLQSLKAVKIIGENYGLALDPEPEVIQLRSVWKRLRELRQRHGRPVRVLRNGDLITLTSPDIDEKRRGIWRVMSVKNNATGLALDLARPDETSSSWRNTLVQSHLKNGLSLVKTSLSGMR